MARSFRAPQLKIPQAPRAAPENRGGHAARGFDLVRTRYWPLLAALVLLAALLPYWRSLGYDFVWDDKVMIGPQLDLRHPGDLGRLWRTPFDTLLRDPALDRTYFRPVVLLSLAADRAVYGGNPAGFHLTNLIWYALACLFLWLFAWEMSGRPIPAAVGACLFALHPAHPESVCFIAGRTDVICGAFLFASLWAAARWGPRIRNELGKLLPASLLLLAALWSKEVAFFASPLPLLALWTRDRRIGSGGLARAAVPLLLSIGVAWVSRVAVLGPHMLPTVSPVEGTGPALLTSVSVVARYLPLLLFPVSLSARHEVPVLTGPDWVFAAGLLILLAIAVGFLLLVRRRSRWAVPLFLFASTLVPLCYVRIIAGALLAERFLFLPSGALALGISMLPGTSGPYLAGIAAPFFLALLLPRVAIWKNDATLYSSMLRDSPNSPYVHAVLGGYYYQKRDLARAIEHHKRAFELKPEFTESLLNLSAAEEESGQVDSAFAHARLLLRLRPGYAAAWYALGNLHVRADRPDSAVSAYRESLRLNPDFAQAENNLGVVLERLGRTEEAIAHYRRAGEILPGYADAANNLARLTGGRPR
ncbi:MAG: tetratricopeptide repeat protein [Candidatus Eisenbacteria bacterium]|uniref:Tetratricopeptide repeat protein n=1 Tax=Eiseniibacteriota bacterium TaxID=2212470 RepID=A0A538T3X7_UNCEI|nr:MAG: tetratricopeptide repeat protein [Candidatus Eisenbacteria bacterium]